MFYLIITIPKKDTFNSHHYFTHEQTLTVREYWPTIILNKSIYSNIFPINVMVTWAFTFFSWIFLLLIRYIFILKSVVILFNGSNSLVANITVITLFVRFHNVVTLQKHCVYHMNENCLSLVSRLIHRNLYNTYRHARTDPATVSKTNFVYRKSRNIMLNENVTIAKPVRHKVDTETKF